MEQKPPRSAYEQTRGLVYFARMLDKIRLKHAEMLKAVSCLAHRSDIMTFFDFYEVDEGKCP